MKLRPLIIDDETRKMFARVKAAAEANRLSVFDCFEIARGRRPAPGDECPQQTCVTHFGYRIVFTIEQQPRLGWCRHISISVPQDEPDMELMPNPAAVQVIAEEFGFREPLSCAWIERYDDGQAINALERLEEQERT